jgi:hypothetical protein
MKTMTGGRYRTKSKPTNNRMLRSIYGAGYGQLRRSSDKRHSSVESKPAVTIED